MLVSVPCQTWGCEVCGRRKSRELARVLLEDAVLDPPQFAITLTTRDPDTTAAAYKLGSKEVWRRLRKRYGGVEYFGFIEFTSGEGRSSGGHRRLHGHYLVKVRDAALDVLEAEAIVRAAWRAHTGAFVVEVAQLLPPGGAIGYLSLHHQKPLQAPPEGWRGMRSRPSKGYFARTPIGELRKQAARSLRIEAMVHAGMSEAEAALRHDLPGGLWGQDSDFASLERGSRFDGVRSMV